MLFILYIWQVPPVSVDVDLLQQALKNSGLSNGNVAISTTSSVTISESVPTSDGVHKDSAALADMSTLVEQSSLASSRPARLSYVSTMAVHDSVTGAIRRHTVRKVVFCVFSSCCHAMLSSEAWVESYVVINNCMLL